MRVVLGLVVVLLVLLGFLAVLPPSGAVLEPARIGAVKALLDRRAHAVETRDEQAFLADLDPSASADFRTRQKQLFDNLADVPVGDWAYRVAGATPLDGVRLPAADEAFAPGVRLAYRLRGVDAEPAVRDLAYLFTRRGDRWYLNSDTALEPVGRKTWRGPWDFGPCVVRSGAGGFVIAHPGGEAFAAKVLGEVDDAVAAVTAVWGEDWSRQVAVVVPGGAEEMRSLVGPGFADGSIAGVAVADRVDPTTHVALGQRVVLNPDTASALPPLPLRVLLRHEITHVAARGRTADGAPMWLLEGFADYVGYRGSEVSPRSAAPALAAVLRSGVPADLPADADFRGASMELAYQEAWTFNEYLVSVVGEPGLVALYRRIAAAGRSDVDALLWETTGRDRASLVRGWQDFLRERFT
ncbi:hypothetical protein [Actinosynnema sp. NPDC020468]|uniref:hypothetical protein n=1 Tax=Actinosynnema sp. NPDC020468 TaxID=3154488 RepID=UPI0033FD2C89